MFGDELIGGFREFKAIWDPQGKMNPRKVVDPYRLDENLRLGTTYAPPELTTHFQFPADEGSFARAALRCVGVGNCRRTHGGTMCPSYMVTREEADSTRGRSRLLFEMLKGATLADGWRDEAVKESLDLCFACKGCKGDCPVNVDMATYKAEFLSHYYEGRVRPRTAYAMGLIAWWSRLAALAPGVVNVLTRAPLLGTLARAGAGIARERAIPTFAAQTFSAWFRKRGASRTGTTDVLLWPDTFSNHFLPERAQAATEVLERFGFHVSLPEKPLCCGRPLYDWGMLDLAKRSLREILVALREPIRSGVPIVGIEPSCVAVFRDELCNLFPHDEDAKRLRSQTFTLSEFLLQHVDVNRFPKLRRKALVQGHCHHKAIMKMKADESVLRAMELDVEVLDAGCCGMAGSFGFEQTHYDISVQVGERALLPRIRDADANTLVLADGFSCREQIGQLTDRRAHHLAEVLLMVSRTRRRNNAGRCRFYRRRKGALLAFRRLEAERVCLWRLRASCTRIRIGTRTLQRGFMNNTSRVLQGKVALVTGAASGIGSAIAVEFARAGARVCINYASNRVGAEQTAAVIDQMGGDAVVLQADVGSESAVDTMFAAAKRTFGSPTILVNNAGIDALGKPIADMSLEEWEASIRTNLTGPFLCARAFVRGVAKAGTGGAKIVNISSVHAEIPRAGASEYCASKGGLRNLTRCLSLELAAQKINVNAIAPGMILTPMNQADLDDPEKLKKDEETIPWRRGGQPEEVARLALYLASGDADYVTGATYVIDGGLMQNQGQGA